MDNEFIKNRAAIAKTDGAEEIKPQKSKSAAMVFARIVRVLTLPTLLFFALMATLYFARREAFSAVGSVAVPVLGIGVFPLLSYPLSMLLPRKIRGRNAQRVMAFAFSAVGYTVAFVLAALWNLGDEVTLMCATYFFSVSLLIVFNLFGVRASGHACGTAGPLVFLCYVVGLWCIIPCAALFGLSAWASVKLSRHTPKEFFFGTVCAVLAFLTALALISI